MTVCGGLQMILSHDASLIPATDEQAVAAHHDVMYMHAYQHDIVDRPQVTMT